MLAFLRSFDRQEKLDLQFLYLKLAISEKCEK